MKSSSTIADRQNDEKALTLIKASYRCFRAERVIKYLMIFLSFSICLAAIFNRYLPTMLPDLENLYQVQEDISTYLNLISGATIVAGIPLGFYTTRMHTEGTVLRDRYDAYVFDNAENKSILRPISDTYVDLYAKKVHKPDEKFYNYIYGDKPTPEEAIAQFEYISEESRSDYNLYLSIQPFFLTIWVGFCILIIIIAVSFNDMFVTTLINIMIPSLSAITTIGTSWYNCRLQMRQLTNLMNCVERIKALPPNEFKQYITDKDKMRQLADGLFNYRSSPFVIPNFLVNRYQRSLEKAKLSAAKPTATGEVAASPSNYAAVTSSGVAASAPSKPKTTAIKTDSATAYKPATRQTAKVENTAATKPTVKTAPAKKDDKTAKATAAKKTETSVKQAQTAKVTATTKAAQTAKTAATAKSNGKATGKERTAQSPKPTVVKKTDKK